MWLSDAISLSPCEWFLDRVRPVRTQAKTSDMAPVLANNDYTTLQFIIISQLDFLAQGRAERRTGALGTGLYLVSHTKSQPETMLRLGIFSLFFAQTKT